MAIIKLNAVITVLLENLPPDNPFAVVVNHPILRLKPTAVPIIPLEAIAINVLILTMRMLNIQILVVLIQDILLNSDVNVL